MDTLTIATIAMTSTSDIAQNLAQADAYVREAAKGGAQWVVLPEMFPYIGPYEPLYEISEPIRGPLYAHLADLARQLRITLFAGSVPERPLGASSQEKKVYNTLYVFNAQGEEIAKYRKTHLFHLLDESGQTSLYAETAGFLAGDQLVSFSHDGWQIGCGICYDLRFPDFFSALARQNGPLDVLVIPAAFTWQTGKHHWQLLLQARAVEQQCYVLAANQTGQHGPGKESWGHALISDPWGKILANTGSQPGIAYGQISKEQVQAYRRRLPALANRRPPLYGL